MFAEEQAWNRGGREVEGGVVGQHVNTSPRHLHDLVPSLSVAKSRELDCIL